ncbi:MAG: hypothetical protein DSO00_08500 [Archaeoglobi archaeon]|nr:MAG: hypothetical protein DSO00_08500 [Archaeoglobi archaeon]
MSKQQYDRKASKLYARLDKLISQSSRDKDVARILKRLRRYREELFTFLEYDEVPASNNHAERMIRPPW